MRIFFILGLLILIVIPTWGQHVIQIGVSNSTWNTSREIVNLGMQTSSASGQGVMISYFYAFKLNDRFNLRLGTGLEFKEFAFKGDKQKFANVWDFYFEEDLTSLDFNDVKFGFQTLYLPVILDFKLTKILFLNFGLSYGIELGGRCKLLVVDEENPFDYNEQKKNLSDILDNDLFLIAGLNFIYKAGENYYISAALQYMQDLTPDRENFPGTMEQSNISISVSFHFEPKPPKH